MEQLLNKLKENNIKIKVVDDQLSLQIPDGYDATEILPEIRSQKQALIDFIKNIQNGKASEIKPARKKDHYPLSSAQKRQYFLQQFDLDSVTYNMPRVLRLQGKLDLKKLHLAFQGLVDRHEIFRTRFMMQEEGPVQMIVEQLTFDLNIAETDEEGLKKQINDFIRPFDLTEAPLLRAEVAKLSGDDHVLMMDMHHIVCDGVSTNIITQELMSLYQQDVLPELKLQYKDYAEWQQSEGASEKLKKERSFWLDQYQELPESLNLPIDLSRPSVRDAEGSSVRFNISVSDTASLKQIAQEQGATMYMVMLSVFNVLLSRLTNQQDIVVGTPTAGRSHDDLSGMVGMFVNTLPLRNFPSAQKPFVQFLKEVKSSTLGAFDHQTYQYEELVDELDVARDTGRNPLFDVMFTYENVENSEGMAVEGLSISPYQESTAQKAKFDISLAAGEDGDQLYVSLNFATDLFLKESVERFSGYFKAIVSAIVANPNGKLGEIEILSDAERKLLIQDFNATEVCYPEEETVLSLFQQQVNRNPDSLALKYVGGTLTYREVNERSDAVAAYLMDQNIGQGSFVGIMLDRDPLLIVTIFGILKSGASYVPISPDYPSERISFIVEDAALSCLICRSESVDQVHTFGVETNVIDQDLLFKELEGLAINISNTVISPDDTAYVIYTSGSTGQPKGVEVNHSSLCNIIQTLEARYPMSGGCYLLKTTHSFDVSCSEIFGWSFSGGSLAILPKKKEGDPQALLQAIEDFGVTHINFVPSMFSTFLDELEHRGNMSIASLRYIFLAGEALPASLVRRFEKLGSGIQLENIYGPTEATIYSCSFSTAELGEERRNVPIGKPLDNIQLYTFDQEQHLAPIGVQGELYIAGKCLAKGYLNRAPLTKEKFVDNPFAPGELMYKTGDYARWLPDGNMEFLGRIDDQVKLRGFRIELGEIEASLASQEEIREVVVLAKGSGNDQYLVSYYVADSEIDRSVLNAHLAERLPDYMIPSHYVWQESFPLTPNGKLDRKALPDPELAVSVVYVPPSNPIEEQLVSIWSSVLKLAPETISVTANFFELGGHSLRATVAVNKIRKELQVEVSLRDFFRYSDIRSLSDFVHLLEHLTETTIPVASDKEHYVLSSAQKRLYFLQQFDPESITYNMPQVMRLRGKLDLMMLRSAFQGLVDRHESFRTRFEMQAEGPVQMIVEDIDFDLKVIESDEAGAAALAKDFIRPFDLTQAPLLRAAIVKLKEEDHILMMDMHHIVSDGVSMQIFTREILSLYQGEVLPSLRLQYKDYSVWQQGEEAADKLQEERRFWLDQYQDVPESLNLPTDYPRPSIRNFDGGSVHFSLPRHETAGLKQLANDEGATMYMVVLTLFNVLLSRITNQHDVVIGTPTAGRFHDDLSGIVGMFVNTLPLRNFPAGDKQFDKFLREVKSSTLGSFDHQTFQYEELIDELEVVRDTSRNPLFDAMFIYQNAEDADDMEVEGLSISPYQDGSAQTAKFDLSLTAEEHEDQLYVSLSYATDLFEKSTIERFSGYFRQIVATVTSDATVQLNEIDILASAERTQLLEEFNGTGVDYPQEKTIIDLFEEQVNRTPDHVALVFDGREMTYKALHEASDKLAFLLREEGVAKDNVVGLLMDRGMDLVVGMLAILKSGGAYLPLDIDYPEERISYLLENSKACLLLSTQSIVDSSDFPVKTICFEAINDMGDGIPLRANTVDPSDLCYIIYTSGTTGAPKGVMVEHRNIVRLFVNDECLFDFDSDDVWTMFHNHTFDFSVWEMYGALLFGGKLVIIPKMIARDPALYLDILKEQKVTVLNQTPSAFYNLIEAEQSQEPAALQLRYIIFGGEALSPSKLSGWQLRHPEVKLINMFGITETTVHVTYKEITDHEISNNIGSIGGPIPTLSVYLLNDKQQPIPKGTIGEVYVGGAGVTRGYLNNEPLTREKFVPNPFKEGERLYKSGDLARWLPNGELEYLGRSDHQVKIRGYRIELGEIEHQLLSHDLIKDTVVIPQKAEGEQYLLGYYVSEEQLEPSVLRGYLLQKLPNYMVPSYFIHLDKIPLNINGKIDKKSLPAPEKVGGTGFVAPSNEAEEALLEVWSDVLGVEGIGVTDNFFLIGGDSIKAIRLSSEINERLGTSLKVADLYLNQTIVELANFDGEASDQEEELKAELESKVREWKEQVHQDESIPDRDKIEDVYPMSAIQKGMVFHSLKDIEAGVYHDQMVHVLNIKAFDYQRFEQSLAIMADRHPILRTSFLLDQYDEQLQVVYQNIDLDVEFCDLSELHEDQQRAFIQTHLTEDKEKSFDFELPGLWRFKIYALGNDRYALCFICHHAIIDGWSDASFNTELNQTYLELQHNTGYSPEPLKSTYKDYVFEEQIALNRPDFAAFWEQELSGYSRYSFTERDIEEGYYNIGHHFPNTISEKLIDFGKLHGFSTKSICYSAFLACLDLFSYHSDLTTGIITNNRPSTIDGDKIIGCFLNTTPVRFEIPRSVSWKELVVQVQQKLDLIKVYDIVPLAKVQEIIGDTPNDQDPITDVIFNYVDFHVYENMQSDDQGQNTFFDAVNEADFDPNNLGAVRDNSGFSFSVSMTGGHLSYTLSHLSTIISTRLAQNFCQYFEVILDKILSAPDEMVSKASLLLPTERLQLLEEFNASEVHYPEEKTAIDLFEEQVIRTPHDVSLGHNDQQITYQELNEKANQLANYLIAKGLQPSEIVGIMLGRSAEMIISILAIMKAGGAYLPLDIKSPATRNERVLRDSKASMLVTGSDHMDFCEGVTIIDVNDPSIGQKSKVNTSVSVDPSDLAYIIYTSGSTGNPKGVMIGHQSLSNYIYSRLERFQITKEEKVLQFSSISFDASIGQIWLGLLSGAQLVLIDEEVILDSSKFNAYIIEQRITHLDATPSYLAQINLTLDSHLKRLVIGGEAIDPTLVSKYGHRYDFYNEYGPTEATIACIDAKCDPATIGQNVPIGKPMSNSTAYILDKEANLLPIGVAGELCIGGAGLAWGYLNDEALTQDKFVSNPFVPGELMYKTGDLAQWLPDGNLEYLGRIDDQVKIRGFRIELGEIEATLSAHEAIKEAVVLAKGEGNDRFLVAYYVADAKIDRSVLKDFLSERLPDYMVPTYLEWQRYFSLTTSGKLDKKSLPDPDFSASDDYVPASNPAEEQLVAIWSTVLKIVPEKISVTTSFFELGGHSLKATVAVNKIRKELQVEVSLRDFFRLPDIRSLAEHINAQHQLSEISIPKAAEKDYYVLSSAQSRMYFLQQFDKESVAYNMPQVIRLTGELDLNALELAFQGLIDRHESLRTRFETLEDGPVQLIVDELAFELEVIETDETRTRKLVQDFVRPFDLSRASLLRASVLKISEEAHLLMMDMHHIISDAVSMNILTQELIALYQGTTLPELALQYKDYAEWQQSEVATRKLAVDRSFWLTQYQGVPEVLDLPVDHTRSTERTFNGGQVHLELTEKETNGLKQLAYEEGATLYMVLLSAFNVLLSRLSRQEDIVIGTPTVGRFHDDLSGMLGMFVNTLPLRNYPEGSKQYDAFLTEVKSATLAYFDHQGYQYEELIDALELPRDTGRNPLFDVMFSYQHESEEIEVQLDGLVISEYEEASHQTEKFDISLLAVEQGDHLSIALNYATDLFNEGTMIRFINYLKRILEVVVKDPSIRLADIKLIDEQEREQLLVSFNDTSISYPKTETVVTLFDQQANARPEDIAVVNGIDRITYSELKERSDSLAQYLKTNLVGPNDIVAIMAGQDIEMIVGVLGILKSGAAFVPIDPGYPVDRINYILEDSAPKMFLSQKKQIKACGYSGAYLDLNEASLYEQKTFQIVDDEFEVNRLAYLIYTSGSTGLPKGTMVSHPALMNLCHWHIRTSELGASDNCTKYAGFGFDASVWEIFPNLLAGATIHMIDEDLKLDVEQLNAYFNRENITVSFLPTQVAEQFLSLENKSLRLLHTGGDRLNHINPTSYQLVNNYGPTENTVVATSYVIESHEADILIGKPIDNTKVYILDSEAHLLPLGVIGEICIAGESLATGYLNQEELTAEKFVPNPFIPGTLMYKSGDLGRWRTDGNLEFIGRIDDQIKIRGFRIELGEIIHHLLQVTEIVEGTVVVKEREGDKYLVAYYVADSQLNEIELRSYLASKLPDYMVPVHYLRLEKLPLNRNGKIDKTLLPEPVLEATIHYEAPTSELEEQLVMLWSDVLNLTEERISVTSNFFELGGHSLKATVLVNKINKALEVQIGLRDLFAHQDIRSLSGYIEGTATVQQDPIVNVADRPYYPLSSAQRRMYVLQEFDKTSAAYNMPNFIRMKGNVSSERLKAAFQSLMERHEILRSSFGLEGEEAVQYVHDDVAIDIATYDGNHESVEDLIHGFVRPFDLGTAPLFRVGLIELADQEHILLFDIHHIIHDGVSNDILISEFVSLYNDQALPTRSLHYKDYAVWQQSEQQAAALAADKRYWMERYVEPSPLLDLPTDYPRPMLSNHHGGHYGFELKGEALEGLRTLSSNSGTTMYMTMLSLVGILLSKLSNQEDLVIGTPTSGRTNADLEGMLGMFVNTLALRLSVKGDQSYSDYLQALKAGVLNSFDHQGYQYEELIDALQIARDTSRNPLFDVLFSYNFVEEEEDLALEGLELAPYVQEDTVAKFDLSITVAEEKDRLYYSLTYASSLFREETIIRFANYLQAIMASVLQDTSLKLHEIDMLPAEERRELLEVFNDTAVSYPVDETLVSLFEARVAQTPDQVAVRYQEEVMTYRQLDEAANQVANYLHKEADIATGDLIGILLPRDNELIIWIYGILKAGAAYIPIDTKLPTARIASIAEESGLKLLITRKAYQRQVSEISGQVIVHEEVAELLKQQASTSLAPSLQPGDLAYVIYTSGSTGKPKGVAIEHQSVINILYHQQAAYPLEEKDAYLFKTSYGFDVSVSELFGWFFAGGCLVVPPVGLEQDVDAIISAIAQFEITHINFAPSAFSPFVDRLFDSDLSRISSLKYIFLAGEELPVELVRRFKSLNVPVRLENIYGPTEGTIYSSSYSIGSVEDMVLLPIGRPMSNIQLYVLDNFHNLVPRGVRGELYIGGSGLARGYLNREELTAERFIDHAFGRLYHTGDMARWLADGNIEYLGRIDDQVKLRGFRIELGEIRHQLQLHHAIEECLVLSREYRGDDFLIAYFTSSETLDHTTLRIYLSGVLPEYMVPTYYVQISSFELNASGKVNRKVLPLPEIEDQIAYVPAETAQEEVLVGLWSEVLKLPVDEVSVTGNFFEMGGHSLRATVLANKINKALDVQVGLRDLFVHQDIRSLSGFIEGAAVVNQNAIERIEGRPYYPLSSAQRRMYVLQEFDKNSVAYNMPKFIRMQGELSVERLEAAFRSLLERHEILRTSFGLEGEEVVQYVHDTLNLDLVTYHGYNEPIEHLLDDFVRPFDLTTAPLFRVGLIQLGVQENILLFDIHHIVHDGVSHEILISEFVAIYNGATLPKSTLNYKDYAVWQQSDQQVAALVADKQYWLEMYAEPSPVLELPTDYPRPVVSDQRGGVHAFQIEGKALGRLRSLSRKEGTTMYMTMLSLFGILLGKLSNQDALVVGTPTAGRNHADLEGMLGMFVNTLALRLSVEGDQSFSSYLRKVRAMALNSFDHQGFQYEELIDALQLARDTSRNPLFDVMFSYARREASEELVLDGLTLSPYEQEGVITKFDLTITVTEENDNLLVSLFYAKSLFREETIERYANYFHKIIDAVLQDTDVALHEIDMLSTEERQELLEVFNDTKVAYPESETIVSLFVSQVAQTPDQVAVRYQEKTMTYQELDELSGRLAKKLRLEGVGADSLVAIMLDPCLEMMAGLLGILKAGAAFLPIDPSYPQQRIKYMLEDSSHQLLLSLPHLMEAINYEGTYWDLSNPKTYETEGTVSLGSPAVTDLCYVIYTSGSTGLPKGVMVEHHSLVNLCHWNNHYYQLSAKDHVTKYAGFGFDASVLEIFPSLVAGATIHVLDESLRLDLKALNAYYNDHGITVSFLPTQVCEQFVALDNHSLRYLLTGGDELTHVSNTDYAVVNNYGPTEGTVVASSFQVDSSSESIPIGKPIDNVQAFILNEHHHLVPKGVKGELYIGGSGLARGYLNQEAMTAERFIIHPFEPNKRLYRTGDIACWQDDGNLRYLGRVDDQIQLRGFRVELGEIRHQLQAYEAVEECLVISQERHQDTFIIAYFTANESIDSLDIRNYLLAVLPEYMVPSFYIQVDAFALTPNGKIDREALPTPDFNDETQYQAPENEIESQMVQVWSEVLKLPKDEISVNSNFFELGGYSLRATVLIKRLHEVLNREVPLQDVFKFPSIRSLSQNLVTHQNGEFSPVEHLVLLNEGKNKANNLFFIHDGSGDVQGYLELSTHLSSHTCWGMRSTSLEQFGPRKMNIEQTAAEYIESFLKVQPKGPFNIAGWSLGGVIAFEVVKQLEAMGEEVNTLLMIDTVFHGRLQTMDAMANSDFTMASEKLILQKYLPIEGRAIEHFSGSMEELWSSSVAHIESIDDNKFKNEIPRAYIPLIPHFDEIDIQNLIKYVNTIRSLEYADLSYEPNVTDKLKAKLIYIGASDTDYGTDFMAEYFEGEVSKSELNTNHFAIMTQPAVDELAAIINQRLNDKPVFSQELIDEPE